MHLGVFRLLSWRAVPAATALLSLLLSAVAMAQTGARVMGTTQDEAGALVTEAKVRLLNARTSIAREARSDAAGRFVFLAVEPGEYSLEAEKEGFQKYERTGITIVLNQVAELDVALAVGSVSESTTIVADASQVETSSTQLGTVVNSRAVEGLPLANRDTYQLLQLQAGVQSQVGADLFFGSDRAGVVSVNGGRGRSNNYMVNGGDGNDTFVNLPAIEPSPDSIQEFRVITNTFDAEYGRNSGSVVNVITKSGANDLHGSLFEFLRNDALNARGFFDIRKPVFQQNQFGATVGGPIAKDRSFFFVSYEGRRVRRGTATDVVTVPTLAERNGDFSASEEFGGAVNDQHTADQLSERLFGSPGLIEPGTPYTELFPGNQIPMAAFDPVAYRLMLMSVPLGTVADGLFQATPIAYERADQGSVRIDHTAGDNHVFSFYYFVNDRTIEQPLARFQAGGANVPGFGTRTRERLQQYNFSHTFTINPTTINEFRFTYLRESQGEYLHPLATNLVRNFGFNVPDGSDRTGITPELGPSREGMPFITLSGAFAIGNNYEGELPQAGNTFQWSDNLSKVIGRHTLKFGADLRRLQFNQFLYFNVNGSYYYYAEGYNSTGNVIADFLLGLPDYYVQGGAQGEALRGTTVYLFGQDSFAIRPNLTFNYGLRWELATPMVDLHDRLQSFRPGQATSLYPCELDGRSAALIDELGGTDCNPGGAAAAVFPLGLVAAGDPGVPSGLTAAYYKAYAPRLGLAWSPSFEPPLLKALFGEAGSSSIRAGWGLFYNPIEQLVLEQLSAQPPFGGSSSIYNPGFSRPFRLQDGSVAPNPFQGVLNPPPGTPVNWALFRPILLYGQLEPELRMQYSAQYNLTFQREIPGDLLVQLAYVGSQGHRLLATEELNPGNPQTCLDLRRLSRVLEDDSIHCGPFFADSSFVVPRIPAGEHLTLPSGQVIAGPYNKPITLVGLRPYSAPLCDPFTGKDCPPDGIPVFSSIFAQNTVANSAYHSLQVTLNKRWGEGLQLLSAYTWSKSIDDASSFENILNPGGRKLSRALSMFDSRHRFVTSWYWEPNVADGWDRLPEWLRQGWAFSGILTMQSGFPIRIHDTQSDRSLIGSYDFEAVDQPELVGRFVTLEPRDNDRYYFDPSAFAPAALGTVGSAPRTLCCGPGILNVDLSIQKTFELGEERYFEFRAEFFNIFNHTQFYNPSGNYQDGEDFGRVRRARDPRLVQFALKYKF